MTQKLVSSLLIIFTFICIGSSLLTQGDQAKSLINQPFKSVRFLNESVFFTTNNGRAFGYLNTSQRGDVEVIYILQDNQRIVDEFTMGDKLIIGNKNKTLIHFEPFNKTFEYDERFINENFTELKGFKQINDKAYIITQNALRYYHKQASGEWVYTKQLISQTTLNPGVQEWYYDLFLFPSKANPERVFIVSTAKFDAGSDKQDNQQKLLSCFKWFNGQSQQVDGACSYEQHLDIKDFRTTKGWAYMRYGNQTYVYDNSLTMKTKWQLLPTQYIDGHVVTTDHLTYLYKTNELAYYRLVQNFQNDDVKLTSTGANINIMKKNKRLIKLNKPENSEVIGSWLLELDQNSFKTLIQFNTGDLHCYRIVKSEESTEINYLFRLAPPREEVKSTEQTQQTEQTEQTEEQTKPIQETPQTEEAKLVEQQAVPTEDANKNTEQTPVEQEQAQILALPPSTPEVESESSEFSESNNQVQNKEL